MKNVDNVDNYVEKVMVTTLSERKARKIKDFAYLCVLKINHKKIHITV